MIIDKVLAVYKTSPVRLVVECENGKLLELSLEELKSSAYTFDDAAWKSLVDDYRIFTCQTASR